MGGWRDDIVRALGRIGGSGHYDEIYDSVQTIRVEPLPPSWKAIVRRVIEQHSSDSEAFAGHADLFRSVEGIGSGVWALRSPMSAPESTPTGHGPDTGHPLHWILVANPDVWDVWDWADSREPFGGWTISQLFEEIHAGDDIALWISGEEAGVYGIGATTSDALEYTPVADHRWRKPPDPTKTAYVEADLNQRFFDRPIRKAELAADPKFAGSLILRMPRGRNPFPVTATEWAALERHAALRGGPTSDHSTATPDGTEAIVSERKVGTVRETVVPPVRIPERVRQQKESRLVNAYQHHLGRDLTVRSALLPSGERLVADGFDLETNTLIEAKSSTDRASFRMAIGQLLDYARFVKPAPSLVILLPDRPSDDLVSLAGSLGIAVVFQSKQTFVEA